MRSARSLPTRLLAAVLALVGAVAAARRARAEEALVLDNGAILRGTVIRDEGDEVVLRLSGVGSDAKVTISRGRIVQRFVTVEPRTAPTGRVEPVAAAEPARTIVQIPALAAKAAPPLPEEEPRAAEESFFRRSARRATMALPSDPGSRGFLAVAAILVVLCLVGLAAKMADIDGLTLGRSTVLALLFVGMVTVDVVFADPFLRADNASILLPIQLLAWVGSAAGILRCGLGRAFHLLAFVAVSTCLVVFSAGIVLVSV